ncbi:O-antigen ligase family protein [Streptomyces griseosporeus]|uniref:O-antigen ligase family protein n=1 Tax=Streptomyces griseosporeus TaxID=1910 RepID=UPI0036FAF933
MIGAPALERRPVTAAGAAAVLTAVGLWVAGRSVPFALLVLAGVPLLVWLVVAAVRRPVLAVAAFAVLLPLGNVELAYATSVAQIAAAVTAVIVLSARIRGRGQRIGWSPVLAASALLVVSALLSALTSASLEHSVLQSANYLFGLALAASVVAATPRRGDLRTVAMAFVIGGGVLCGGVLTVMPHLESHYGTTLVDNRPVGTFAQPNELGLWSAIVLCVSMAMAVTTLRQGRRGLSLVAGVAALTAAGALVLTLSRGAWIGAFAGLAVLVVLLRGARRPLLLGLGSVCAVLLALLVVTPSSPHSPIFTERLVSIFTGERSPYDERPAAWSGSVQQMTANPVLGSGPGAYPEAAQRGLAQFTDQRQVQHAHVLYLTVGAEQGVLGLAALAGAIVVGGREALRNRTETWRPGPASGGPAVRPPPERGTLTGVSAATVAGLTVVLAEGVVDYALRNPVLGMTAWLLIGLLAACARARPATESIDIPQVAEMKRLTETEGTSGTRPTPRARQGPAKDRHLPPVSRSVRRRVLAGLLVGLLVLGAGLAVIALQPTRYAVTSTVSLAPRSQPDVSADIVQLAAGKYAVTAGATRTLEFAARQSSMSTSQLRDDLDVSVQQQTANIDITVTSPNASQSAEAANAIAAVVARQTDGDRLISGEVTAPADADAATRKPSRTLLTAISVVAAVLAGGWAAFAVGRLDRRSDGEAR